MKKELWLGLRRYRFDHLVPPHMLDRVAAALGHGDVSTRAFASKVARKNGWTTAFALRAIGEYKKFVYLGMVADGGVTPSKAIDAVWHEHILFSAAYRDFCREVLGRPFDHHPELMPDKGQTEIFQARFAATLALYRAEFNAEPPADVWGTPKFGRQDRPSRFARGRQADVVMATDTTGGDAPLYTYFESAGAGESTSTSDAGFGGGGGFSGGGGGSSWSSDDTSASGDGGGGDGGSSDGGDGGSGCSSSCSGGCSSD